MKTLQNKLIIYDSNCKVCSSMKDVIIRLTDIPTEKIKAYRNLNDAQTTQVDPEKFKYVMAVIDTSGGQTLYGAQGVAFIFSATSKFINLILSFKPVYWIFEFLYNLQANNRYIIALPKSKYDCDCLPKPILIYRLSYILLCITVATLITFLFGVSIAGKILDPSYVTAGSQMVLIAGTGWLIQILIAVSFLKEKILDYLGHLAGIMVIGVIVLIPCLAFNLLFGTSIIYTVFCIFLSSLTMLHFHRVRTKYLRITSLYTVTWFFALQSSALFWIFKLLSL